VPFTDVQIRDGFWRPRQETNALPPSPSTWITLKKPAIWRTSGWLPQGATNGFQGRVHGFGRLQGARAASYSLATHPDPLLAGKLDAIIATIAAAQQPDGYLDTYYIVKEPGHRWTNLRDNHELYCAGASDRGRRRAFSGNRETDVLERGHEAGGPPLTRCSVRRPNGWAIPATRSSSWRWSSCGARPGNGATSTSPGSSFRTAAAITSPPNTHTRRPVRRHLLAG